MSRLARPRLPLHQAIISLALLLLIPFFVRTNRSNQLSARATAGNQLTVQFSPPSGAYEQDITVRLETTSPNSQILFTTDGSVPVPGSSAIYRRPLLFKAELAQVVTFRARIISRDGELGPVADAVYFLGVETSIPLLAVTIDPADLWSPERGIYAHPERRGRDWERPIHLTYLDENGRLGFQTNAGLRIHGNISRQYEKKSFRLYFRGAYGLPSLNYPLFPDSEIAEFNQLVLHAGGQDFPQFMANGTLLRNHLIAKLAAQIDGYAVQNQPVVLFLNGELWGVYHLRERIDENFLTDNYGIGILPGDEDHYAQLEQFLANNSLAQPANYVALQTQMDVANFIDYTILQLYSANSDWPNNNISRFRGHTQGGRWQWIYWDVDNAFALAPASSLNFDMVDQTLNQANWLPLVRLLENAEFRAAFIERTADLLNTTLHPDNVVRELDALAAELEASINYETSRWPGSGDWQANVEEMRQFARLRPDILRQQMMAGLGLSGTAVLTINPPLAGNGSAAVNDCLLNDFPWDGVYFVDTAVRITAIPDPGYRFAGWEPAHLPQTAVLTLPVNHDQSLTPRFEPVSPGAPQAGDVVINAFGHAGNHILAGKPVAGEWIELLVRRPGGVNLQGWRLTDNDTKTGMDEGSLIFGGHQALANVPQGSSVWLIVSETATNDLNFPEDDLNGRDQSLILYAGNGNLNLTTDPWFHLGPLDNLALLAPGPTDSFEDDQGVDFVTLGKRSSAINPVTPNSFGILQDGVTGRRLGN